MQESTIESSQVARSRLERRADELLLTSAREAGRGDYPFHTQRWMDLLAAREGAGVEHLPAPPPEPVEHCALLARVLADADLTRRQRQVIRLLAAGLRQAEIAARLSISQAQVSRLKQAAIRAMRRWAAITAARQGTR